MASHLARLLFLGLLTLPSAVSAQAASQEPGAAFRHDRHKAFACVDCHVMQPDHGALVVRRTADCQGCHHAPERTGLSCTYCHSATELREVGGPQSRILTLSVFTGSVQRALDFSHVDHEARDCTDCHRDGPTLEPETLDCGSCHGEHHEITNDGCWRCHRAPPDSAHTPEVHTSCAGSGCHVDPPIAAPPRSRVGCLWCHEPQRDHEPQGVCEDCHVVRREALGADARLSHLAFQLRRSDRYLTTRSTPGARRPPSMPICSYLVIPRQGSKASVRARLSRLPGCDVVAARNRDVLILVTETGSLEEEGDLRARVEAIEDVQALMLTFGEIDPDAPIADPIATGRR